MPITPGQTGDAADFINESERDATPANDEGRVPKLESDGKLSGKFIDLNLSSGTSSPVSLTTDGTEKVLVIAKGTFSHPLGSATFTVSLKYNDVVKDTAVITIENDNTPLSVPFILMYTETPAAGTHDITVTASTGTLSALSIIALKL